jgi:Tol biopolymer transport system component
MAIKLDLLLAGRVAFMAACLGSNLVAAAPQAKADELLFMSNRSGSVFELYRMSPSGGEAQRVLPERGEAGEMSWSPDGSRVLYTRARPGEMLNIYVADLSTGASRQLTRDALPCTQPSWSPDGRTIAFVATRGAARKIYLMDADGGHQRRLTDSDTDDEMSPRFAPSGDKIAYLASRLEVAPKVAVVDVKSGKGGIVSPIKERGVETPPLWSPDGKQLLFSSVRGVSSQVLKMAADGSARVQLTSVGGRHGQAQWSNDGKHILFMTIPAGAARPLLQLMNADGSEIRTLYGGANDLMDARWSSDDRRVFFVEQLPSGGKIFALELASGTVSRLSGNEGFDIGIEVYAGRPAARLAGLQ